MCLKGTFTRTLPSAEEEPKPLSQVAPAIRAKYDSLITRNQIKTVSSARTQVMPPHSHTPCRVRSHSLAVQFLPQPL
uniref:Uncharacterized protein n=1 Tax=Zosterops lateralis melanops TaxID=1220523 RepID=A0A8D2NVU9_ZOSLA